MLLPAKPALAQRQKVTLVCNCVSCPFISIQHVTVFQGETNGD